MADVINLPPMPGLPDVQLAPGIVATAPLVADTLDVLAALGSPAWGIYSNGAPVVIADIVADLGYSKGFAISDYPVEEGGFESFDSVEQPYEARVRFASGGSLAAREVLLSSIEAIVGDLKFYDLVMPERVYINANLLRYEFRRTNQGGASLLIVDVTLQEVRVASGSGSMGFNPKDPASANPVNLGNTQPEPATPTQTANALPFFASGVTLPPSLNGLGS